MADFTNAGFPGWIARRDTLVPQTSVTNGDIRLDPATGEYVLLDIYGGWDGDYDSLEEAELALNTRLCADPQDDR